MSKLARLLLALAALLGLAAPAHADRDLTFFLISDIHAGRERWKKYGEENSNATRLAMVQAANWSWPAKGYDLDNPSDSTVALGASGKLGRPRGLLIAGDLTDSGNKRDWDGVKPGDAELAWLCTKNASTSGYCGCTGSGAICVPGLKQLWLDAAPFPIYEGFGNHDVENVGRKGGDTDELHVTGRIVSRNAHRPNVVNSDAHGYYSWDWDDVHFVNLNAYAGTKTKLSNGGIGFLRDDLRRFASNGKAVVLMQHLGFQNNCTGQLSGRPYPDANSWNTNDRSWTCPDDSKKTCTCESNKKDQDYWTAAEGQELIDALAGYNVVLILAGHDHGWRTYKTPGGIRVLHTGYGREGDWTAVKLRQSDAVAVFVNKSQVQSAYKFALPRPKPTRTLTTHR